MKVFFKDLQVGNCFVDPKGETKKKVSESKASIRKDDDHKIKTRKVKGNTEVEHIACPVYLLGVGLRRHPDMVVEIGDGNPFRKGRRKS